MASLSPSYFGRPQVTSTASCVVKRRPTCIDHLGIQVESREELSELAGRLKTAGAVTVDQADASCCYAKSDKSWVKDPSGVSWETFFTFGAATVYGEDTIEDERAAYSTSGISKSFLVKNSTRPVATAAALGQKQTFKRLRLMSALPPKADIKTDLRNPLAKMQRIFELGFLLMAFRRLVVLAK